MAEIILSLVSLSLIALNLIQLIYWSRQTQKLIDKLMSRNYPEYVHTQNLAATLPTPQEQFKIEDGPDVELDALNRMLGEIK